MYGRDSDKETNGRDKKRLRTLCVNPNKVVQRSIPFLWMKRVSGDYTRERRETAKLIHARTKTKGSTET